MKRLLRRRLFGFQLKTLIAAGVAGLLGAVALLADLQFDGMAEDVLWNITGETEPLPQLLGTAQYISNYTRQNPDVGDTTTIQHIPENPFGINAFLELEAVPEKRERAMRLIADAGIGWLRQQFTWEDIEIHAKSDFVDRRNDPNGISAWEKYDQIVALAAQYNVNILARISTPTPDWALAPGTTQAFGPPANYQDFVDFAVRIAKRYEGQITHYQIWNEPNLYPEWGEQLVSPEDYTDLLCRTYTALKEVDPNIVVHSAAIGPTINLSGRDAYDMLYVQRMYNAGAGACFDVMSAQGYGLFSGPTDQRLRPYLMNFGRHEWLRDLMVANGDAHKPIWISEAGWNPVPNDPTINGFDTYGQVTMEQAAAWAPLAYERALSEWPWVGAMNYWFLKRPNELEQGEAWYYFRLVEPSWEPTPIYESLQAYIQSGEWRNARGSDDYEARARAQIPQILVIGWAIVFVGYVFTNGILNRLLDNDEPDTA